MKASFSRNKRLKNKEIQSLLKKAKRAGEKDIILYASKNKLPFCRLAISISRKFIKLSSKRNLFRRRIKAAILEAEKKAVIVGGYDILVVVRTHAPLSYELIKKKAFSLLRRIK